MILQATADFRQSLWNLEALAGLDTSEALKLKKYPSKQRENGCELAPTNASNAKKLKHTPAWTPG